MTSPNVSNPLVDKTGRLNREWVDYLTREIANIALLDGSTDPAAISAKLDELITACIKAGMMKKG